MKYKHLAMLMGVMITATSVGSTATAFAADSKTESTQDADDTIEDTAEASDEKADDSKEETNENEILGEVKSVEDGKITIAVGTRKEMSQPGEQPQGGENSEAPEKPDGDDAKADGDAKGSKDADSEKTDDASTDESSDTDEETEDLVDESKDENSETAYPIVGLTPGKKETEKKSVEEPVSILAALEKPTVVVETPATESKQEKANLETVSTMLPTQTTTTSTEAQNFIDTYLTSSAGNVYTQANSLNYRNILNGLSTWNKFTAATRSDVNAILKTRVGKTYQTLLKEAQTIQFNGVSQTVAGGSINTATQSNAGLYGALMGLSVGLFGLFFK